MRSSQSDRYVTRIYTYARASQNRRRLRRTFARRRRKTFCFWRLRYSFTYFSARLKRNLRFCCCFCPTGQKASEAKCLFSYGGREDREDGFFFFLFWFASLAEQVADLAKHPQALPTAGNDLRERLAPLQDGLRNDLHAICRLGISADCVKVLRQTSSDSPLYLTGVSSKQSSRQQFPSKRCPERCCIERKRTFEGVLKTEERQMRFRPLPPAAEAVETHHMWLKID
jgi:hypothetical protein